MRGADITQEEGLSIKQ